MDNSSLDWRELLADIPANLQDDPVSRYFSCRFADRYSILQISEATERRKITEELNRIAALRASYTSRKDAKLHQKEIECREKIAKLRQSSIISKDKAANQKEVELLKKEIKSLSNEIRGSTTLFEKFAKSRQTWREHAENNGEGAEVEMRNRFKNPAYTQERYRRQRKIRSRVGSEDWKISGQPILPQPYDTNKEDGLKSFKVYEVNLKKDSRAQDLNRFVYSKYSLKKYPLGDVLCDDENSPLAKKCDRDTIRYFHFPANNMLWVEEAITRYYGETRGEYNYRKAPDYRIRSSNILCSEFWTGQQQGNASDPIHARHMRPHCSYISSVNRGQDISELDDSFTGRAPSYSSLANESKTAGNFVIFMPYLHWETDKRRRKMAEVMRASTLDHRQELQKEYPHLNNEFREQITTTVEKTRRRFVTPLPRTRAEEQNSTDYLEATSRTIQKDPLWRHTNVTPLAQYLLYTAQVFEAMDIEPDVRILTDHLYPLQLERERRKEPPLHARRTLRQAYHSKVEDAQLRDDDQVVSRGTRAGKSLFKTTKVVMVDQLWLYILDNNTVITFFPRRWGRNEPDLSGVHHSIRDRLQHMHAMNIESVYDLATLIIDECSRTFFDRTRPADNRPQVLDIFSSAISFLTELKSVAYESFWWNLQKLRLDDPKKTEIESIEAAAQMCLDVNPEGMLMREVSDVIDEVRAMIGIYFQQMQVGSVFSKALQELSRQESTESKLLEGLKKTLNTMNSRQAGMVWDSDMHAITPHQNEEEEQLRTIPENTIYKANNLLIEIQERLKEIQMLEESAREIIDQLRDLLSLKQQQAGIIEARAAFIKESNTQRWAIMVFTIVTIIFLPLSFMSSVFGMNALEFSGPDGATMPLRKQFKIMFPVSVGVIFLSLAVAFSLWIRNAISLLVSVLWAVMIHPGEVIYRLRLYLGSEKYLYNANGLRLRKQKVDADLNRRQDWKKERKRLKRENKIADDSWNIRANFPENVEAYDLDNGLESNQAAYLRRTQTVDRDFV